MTGELFTEDQLRSRHERADPGLESAFDYDAALARTVESLRTTAQVDLARVAARSRMRHHGQLMRAGRGNEADKAAAQAESMSDPCRTPDVELELAARAAAIGSLEEAERRYRRLLAALGGESALGAVAAFRLAHLRIERGARDEAIALWEFALRGADENLRPHVLVELADGLRGRGRRDQVERLYAQAIATDHPDLAPQAALTLGGLREEAGDNKGALKLYELVAASHHPDYAADAKARHVALIHGRTRRAIEQMLLFDLKNGCDALPDDGPSARECTDERGSAAHFVALPSWSRRPRADPVPPHDLGHRRLSRFKRLLTRLLDHEGGLGLLGTIGSQHERKPEAAREMPIAAGSHIPDASPTEAGDPGLDYVVISGNGTAATSVGRGAHANHKIAVVCVNGVRSYEQAGLQDIADAMSRGGAGLGGFADPSMDIETAKNLALCRLCADQQSRCDNLLAVPSVGPDEQPNPLIEGRAIGLAFGDTQASARDVGAGGPASSDDLLLSHITHVLTALHCKEALITGSLIGMSGNRWSDAMDELDPLLTRWCAVFEGPAAACRCESTTCRPGAGCLSQR